MALTGKEERQEELHLIIPLPHHMELLRQTMLKGYDMTKFEGKTVGEIIDYIYGLIGMTQEGIENVRREQDTERSESGGYTDQYDGVGCEV